VTWREENTVARHTSITLSFISELRRCVALCSAWRSTRACLRLWKSHEPSNDDDDTLRVCLWGDTSVLLVLISGGNNGSAHTIRWRTPWYTTRTTAMTTTRTESRVVIHDARQHRLEVRRSQ
jgi:hypothetical protein